MPRQADTIAIIGGGRWARVWGDSLLQSSADFDVLAFVTRANQSACQAARPAAGSRARQVLVLPTIEALLGQAAVRAAVIANASREHCAAARRVLEARIPVLVEKPFALSLDEAKSVMERSENLNCRAAPALHLRFCSYVHALASAVATRAQPPQTFEIAWDDPESELRYGAAKSYDASINVAADVMPHVWTLLCVVLDANEVAVEQCTIERGGLGARFLLDVRGIRGTASLRRDAPRRERSIALRWQQGPDLVLDFSTEPGVLHAAEGARSADRDWARRPRPLALQLTEFLSSPPGHRSDDSRRALSCVATTQRAAALVRQAQLDQLRRGTLQGADKTNALRELLAPRLIERGVVDAGDSRRLTLLAARAGSEAHPEGEHDALANVLVASLQELDLGGG